MATNPLSEFIDFLSHNFRNKQFIRIIISNKRNKTSDLKTVSGRLVMLKNELKISFVYRHNTKDITKNHDFSTAIKLVEEMLTKDFFQADIFTTSENLFLIINKKNEVRISRKAISAVETPDLGHDNSKKRFIAIKDNVYLSELGITNMEGKIRNNMEDKYRQIDKYVEILDGIIKSVDLPDNFSIVDMGSGKGYLTFALYDYLINTLKQHAEVTGIESRPQLVDTTNAIALKAGFKHLHFKTGNIQDTPIDKTDVLIALHACDTATDDAIYRGIQQKASVIICAPCCHKQIRQQLDPQNVLKQITRFGILAERQAEMITDAIRAMILEAYGYKTKVFEFISGEHTPKNLLIVGIKKKAVTAPDPGILAEVEEIKKIYNIQFHYLEKLLNLNQTP
jgi:SAM-dependent methyltransferase